MDKGKINGGTAEYIKSVSGSSVSDILCSVYTALEEKGYDPVGQIAGYLISGDPTYITNYKNARFLLSTLQRDEILVFLVSYFLKNNTVPQHSDGKKE